MVIGAMVGATWAGVLTAVRVHPVDRLIVPLDEENRGVWPGLAKNGDKVNGEALDDTPVEAASRVVGTNIFHHVELAVQHKNDRVELGQQLRHLPRDGWAPRKQSQIKIKW